MTDAATIIRSVCRRRKVHPADALRRYGLFADNAKAARIEIARRLRDDLNLSLPAIGRAMGGRHHTTILYYLRKAA